MEKKIHPDVYVDGLMLLTNPFASAGARELQNVRVAEYMHYFHANFDAPSP